MCFRRRRSRPLVFAALVLLAGPPSAVLAADEADALDRAADAVAAAKRSVLTRHPAAMVVTALDGAAAALDALAPPPMPEPLPVAVGAGEDESERVAEENKRRLADWRKEREGWEKRAERLRTSWVEVLGRALTLERILRQTETNLYAEVNRRALALLAATGRGDAALEVTGAIEAWLRTPAYVGIYGFVREAFEALPGFSSPEVYEWLRRSFVVPGQRLPDMLSLVRIRKGGPNVPGPDALLFALRAIADHTHMPGRARHAMVRDLIAVYLPLEARAADGKDTQVWDRLGAAAIAATWRQAGEPRDAAGVALGSMADLRAWFRAHRSLRDAAWAD